jgi:hypothetical protein
MFSGYLDTKFYPNLSGGLGDDTCKRTDGNQLLIIRSNYILNADTKQHLVNCSNFSQFIHSLTNIHFTKLKLTLHRYKIFRDYQCLYIIKY